MNNYKERHVIIMVLEANKSLAYIKNSTFVRIKAEI